MRTSADAPNHVAVPSSSVSTRRGETPDANAAPSRTSFRAAGISPVEFVATAIRAPAGLYGSDETRTVSAVSLFPAIAAGSAMR